MYKFTITAELSMLIKTMRIQNKITSKNLAAHIGKSISYVSRLESGGIKMIQEQELTKILSYITEGEDFYQDKLPAIIQAMASFQGQENMGRQIWLMHYDGIARPISVPEAMIDHMNQLMGERGLTVKQLAERVNHDGIYPFSTIPENQVFEYTYRNIRCLAIRISVEEPRMQKLLSKEDTVTNYCTIQSIVSALLRPENFLQTAAGEEQEQQHLQQTHLYMERFGITSLLYAQNLVSPENILKTNYSVHAEFTASNQENIDSIMKVFNAAAAHNNLKTAQALENMRQNLEWDPSFAMEIIGLPFHDLGHMSFHLKKAMIDDIRKTVNRYRDIPEHMREFEEY